MIGFMANGNATHNNLSQSYIMIDGYADLISAIYTISQSAFCTYKIAQSHRMVPMALSFIFLSHYIKRVQNSYHFTVTLNILPDSLLVSHSPLIFAQMTIS